MQDFLSTADTMGEQSRSSDTPAFRCFHGFEGMLHEILAENGPKFLETQVARLLSRLGGLEDHRGFGHPARHPEVGEVK